MLVLIEIQSNVVSVKSKEVIPSFVGSAESKGIKDDQSTGRCEKSAAAVAGTP
jgi:hypothetical protein